ncbi:hypothetical protein ABZX94_28505, partial [Streptomyces seoulensis]
MSAPYTVRIAEDPADREACFAVRKEVFVGEQGVPEDIEYDAHDATALHVLATGADGIPLGTGRLLHGEAAAGKTGGDAATNVLHYAQEIFEGLKAYRQPDGTVA